MMYSSGGTEISTVSEKGLSAWMQSPVEKNSNYDYFDTKYILNTNYSINIKTNIVIT